MIIQAFLHKWSVPQAVVFSNCSSNIKENQHFILTDSLLSFLASVNSFLGHPTHLALYTELHTSVLVPVHTALLKAVLVECNIVS